MAGIARAVAPGVPHHITQRGNRWKQTGPDAWPWPPQPAAEAVRKIVSCPVRPANPNPSDWIRLCPAPQRGEAGRRAGFPYVVRILGRSEKSTTAGTVRPPIPEAKNRTAVTARRGESGPGMHSGGPPGVPRGGPPGMPPGGPTGGASGRATRGDPGGWRQDFGHALENAMVRPCFRAFEKLSWIYTELAVEVGVLARERPACRPWDTTRNPRADFGHVPMSAESGHVPRRNSVMSRAGRNRVCLSHFELSRV